MRKSRNVSTKLLAGLTASLLMFCVPVVAQASATPTKAATVAVQAASQAKVTTKQLKAKIVSVSYNEDTLNFSYKIQFTNTSSEKITKAKIRTVSSLGEDVVRDKTVTLNLAAGKSKTVTVSLPGLSTIFPKETVTVLDFPAARFKVIVLSRTTSSPKLLTVRIFAFVIFTEELFVN